MQYYFENYAVLWLYICVYIYIAFYYCKKKLHHFILLKVHDSSEQRSETSESGLKEKRKKWKEGNSPFPQYLT